MTIKSIKKAIDVLDCFSIDKDVLGVADISRMTGITPSTVSRILSTLRRKHCVEIDPKSGRYCLGTKVYGWAQIVHSRLKLSEVALPAMGELRDACGEEVALYIREGISRICIAKVDSTYNVAKKTTIGVPLPFHCGAAGKVLLAYQPVAIRKRLISMPLEQYTPFTITDPTVLEEELEKIRDEGVAYSTSEREVGAYSIVAPVRNGFSEVVASLSISGPQFRLSEEKVAVYKKLVQDAAEKISVNLGFRWPRKEERK